MNLGAVDYQESGLVQESHKQKSLSKRLHCWVGGTRNEQPTDYK